jgi:hypothetical protein
MKWPIWSITTTDSHDFLPLMFGIMFLLLSAPPFFMVMFNADQSAGAFVTSLLIVLGGGIVIGTSFVIFGLRICSFPGSRLYRITHGRFFWR